MTAARRAARTRRMASQRVWATEEAVDAIVHLRNQIGTFVLRHVAGDEGAPEVQLAHSRDRGAPDDICIGTVGGVLFMIDRQHDVALGYPDFHVDVTPTRLQNDATGVRAQYHLISRTIGRD